MSTSESATGVLLPAEYLSGSELLAAQEANRLNPSTPHMPYLYGQLVVDEVVSILATERLFTEDADLELWTSILRGRLRVGSQQLNHSVSMARSDLSERGLTHLSDLDDQSLIDALVVNHYNFLVEAEKREPELQRAKEHFVTRMHTAIDHQGLPITHEQLDQRLEGLIVGFCDPLGKDGEGAAYSAESRHVTIPLTSSGRDLVLDNEYHELLHAVSGHRFVVDVDSPLGLESKRIGLSQPKSRAWLDEAVVELLTNILLDERGAEWNFDDTKPLYIATNDGSNVYEVMRRLPSSELPIYSDFKDAALKATESIPTRILLSAYFKQDHDEFEADQMAGTHAERTLQRAFKMAGGVKRVAQLRVIEKAFSQDDSEAALRVASEIRDHDREFLERFRVNTNRRRLIEHTIRYRNQIEQVRRPR